MGGWGRTAGEEHPISEDPTTAAREVDVVVIGGGQAGLATGFYLRRAGLVPGRDLVVVDAADRPGGSWPRTWDGLRLFSPASYSSLPGWMMPPWGDATRGFPTRDHVVSYLTRYEQRYDLQVARPHRVGSVRRRDDDVDGRVLFATARARIKALEEGREHAGVAGLGDIVMVASVKDARERGVLDARPMFSRLTPHGIAWADGTTQECDAVIWCTGFRPALRHLHPLGLRTRGGHILVGGPSGTQALDEPRLHLVGYGDWTGPASATLAGVGPSARAAAAAVTGR